MRELGLHSGTDEADLSFIIHEDGKMEIDANQTPFGYVSATITKEQVEKLKEFLSDKN
jgi:hypothetical protein